MISLIFRRNFPDFQNSRRYIFRCFNDFRCHLLYSLHFNFIQRAAIFAVTKKYVTSLFQSFPPLIFHRSMLLHCSAEKSLETNINTKRERCFVYPLPLPTLLSSNLPLPFPSISIIQKTQEKGRWNNCKARNKAFEQFPRSLL